MLLGFSPTIQGKPTYFDRKILLGMYLNERLKTELSEKELVFAEYFLQHQQLHPKLHTLRTDAHNRWNPGMLIHMVYGMRTKQCRLIAPVVKCISVQEVEIVSMDAEGWSRDSCADYDNSVLAMIRTTGLAFEPKRFLVYVDGVSLRPYMIEQLAKNDGFNSSEEFFQYFSTTQTLRLIHWTDLKY